MKILMVLDREFPPDIRVENEIDALIGEGYEVHIACYTKKKKPRYEVINKIHIHRKRISILVYKSSIGCLKVPVYFRFWNSFIQELLNNINFDVIHIHDLPLAKVGFTVSKKFHIPFILDLHENWPSYLEISDHTKSLLGKLLSNNNQWRRYEKEYVNKADYVITVVEEMKERICKLGASCDKIIVLSNTFNLKNAFPVTNQTVSGKIILYFAGGINKQRGIQIIIKGLKQLITKKKDIELWIIGSGKYLKSLKELVKKEKVSNYVKFYGQTTFEEAMSLLSQSDIALIPHLKSEQTDNSSPNKLYQYMYFKKPIVASNCNSIQRIINNTNCGFVYKFDDPLSFSNTIIDLIDSGLMETYGNNGRRAVFNQYNWKTSVQSLLDIYNNL